MRPPQPSPIGPQNAPCCPQVRGVQIPLPSPPHRLGTPPPPQVSGDMQTPQSIVPPQPSDCGPQVAPWAAQFSGVQISDMPQTPGSQRPHVSPSSVHVPQSRTSPQPSPVGPHAMPSSSQVSGVQLPPPQTPGSLPPPQVCAALHGTQGEPFAPQASSLVAVMQNSPSQQPAQVSAHDVFGFLPWR
jgi:hypothetical protein